MATAASAALISAAMKSKILSIVNVFETGSVQGDYGAISIYKDGSGNTPQITYGRSQTTEQGNLRTLIEMYVANGGNWAIAFVPYIGRIGKDSLVQDYAFVDLLRKAGGDPVMISTQDVFFDIKYYQPAYNWWSTEAFATPLALLVVYDSFIQSGSIKDNLRNRFPERPPKDGGKEQAWIAAYVAVRQHGLSTFSRPAVRASVYRTKCFKEQINDSNWDLSQGVLANGVVVP